MQENSLVHAKEEQVIVVVTCQMRCHLNCRVESSEADLADVLVVESDEVLVLWSSL